MILKKTNINNIVLQFSNYHEKKHYIKSSYVCFFKFNFVVRNCVVYFLVGNSSFMILSMVKSFKSFFILSNVVLFSNRKWLIVTEVICRNLTPVVWQCREQKIHYYLHKSGDMSYSQCRLFHHSSLLYKRRKTKEERVSIMYCSLGLVVFLL